MALVMVLFLTVNKKVSYELIHSKLIWEKPDDFLEPP